MRGVLLLVFVCFKSHAGATFVGWEVNEVYTNPAGDVQYIELIAEPNANLNIGGGAIQILSDTTVVDLVLPGDFYEPTYFLIANQGFIQSPGGIVPDLLVQGALFDPNTGVLSIGLNQDVFLLDPFDFPADDFYSVNADASFGINSPTNNELEQGQLAESPIFVGTFEGCQNPITQYRDADEDTYGNPFNAASFCQLRAGYVLNATDCDDNDPARFPGQDDIPDLSYVDSNCDGIDGDLANSVFVTPGAEGSGLTSADPTGDLYLAQQLAQDNNRSWVLISIGQYDFGTFVDGADLIPGIHLAGAYINDFATRTASPAFPTVLSTPFNGAELDMGSQPQYIQHVRFVGANNAPASGTTYGLTVRNSIGVMLQAVELFPGRGGHGVNGLFGANGANGGFSANGGNGVENDGGVCDENSAPTRGSGGSSSCGVAGGRGGSAGLENGNGSPGSRGQNLGAWGGTGGTGNGGQSTRHGGNGSHGDPGINGLFGAGANNTVQFINFEYKIFSGADGADGTAGKGGGGGGGGGGGAFACDSYGGAGGGGGGGGCGGTGGTGGQGGGASIALRLINAEVNLEQVVLMTTAAGNGGDGGGGGFRGLGRGGGAGGAEEDDSGRGGRGGDGGNGGAGGQGGGGAGGAVIGVVCLDGAMYTADQNTVFSINGAGAGGTGGGQDGQTMIDFQCL